MILGEVGPVRKGDLSPELRWKNSQIILVRNNRIFLNKIHKNSDQEGMEKRIRIAIIGGCGHVGLPLGVVLANAPGLDVELVDISEENVATVNKGDFYFVEDGGDELLKKVIGKTLSATTDHSVVSNADYVIFITGTPVDEHLNPRVDDLIRIIQHYLPFLRPEQTVILRSTVFPGSTELVKKYLDEQKPGIKLAFCPERVAQGHAVKEIKNLPQIISAFDKAAEDEAANLFSKIADELIFVTPEEAELIKLFANGWRYLHFAAANQFYIIAESYGIDFRTIHQALTYHYPRAADFAMPGLTAGPCLFKDTMQLSAFHHNNFFLGHAAMLVNEGMPNFLVQQLEEKLGPLGEKKIGLLGMSFKANHDDIRESLSYKLKKVLEAKRAIVLDTDTYQDTHENLDKILNTADGFIIGSPHREYLNLNFNGRPVIDCWGSLDSPPDLSKSSFAEKKLKKAS